MTAEEYEARFGYKPVLDDLQRVNCARPGKIGHLLCGVCETCNKPRFQCECTTKSTQGE
jgi:hypothetical protein